MEGAENPEEIELLKIAHGIVDVPVKRTPLSSIEGTSIDNIQKSNKKEKKRDKKEKEKTKIKEKSKKNSKTEKKTKNKKTKLTESSDSDKSDKSDKESTEKNVQQYNINTQKIVAKIKIKLDLNKPSVGYAYSKVIEDWINDTSYDNIQHINGLLIWEDEFSNNYDKTSMPVVITNVMSEWKANSWTPQNLAEKYGEINFLVGGSWFFEERSSMKLKAFVEYIEHNDDDYPLLLHDYGFNRRQSSKPLKNDYKEPTFFGKDYLGYMAEARRPPWRFFTIAPKRSGLKVYRNPYRESTWDAVITGKRRYILFEPDWPKEFIKGITSKEVDHKTVQIEPLMYFDKVLPKVLQCEELKDPWDRYEVYQWIVNSGELIYIPSGWHYSFVALEDSISISQGFTTLVNFESVWRAMRIKDKRLAYLWYEFIHRFEPLASRKIKQWNEKDGWIEWVKEFEEKRQQKVTNGLISLNSELNKYKNNL